MQNNSYDFHEPACNDVTDRLCPVKSKNVKLILYCGPHRVHFDLMWVGSVKFQFLCVKSVTVDSLKYQHKHKQFKNYVSVFLHGKEML